MTRNPTNAPPVPTDAQRLDRGTWLEPEERAYPNGGQTRRAVAIWPDGQARLVWAGIPDTYFSIPAHGRIGGRYVAGYLSVETADGSDVDTGQDRWFAFRVRTPNPKGGTA